MRCSVHWRTSDIRHACPAHTSSTPIPTTHQPYHNNVRTAHTHRGLQVSRMSTKGETCACCSATHSRVMVLMLDSLSSHQQEPGVTSPARIARTLHARTQHQKAHSLQQGECNLGPLQLWCSRVHTASNSPSLQRLQQCECNQNPLAHAPTMANKVGETCVAAAQLRLTFHSSSCMPCAWLPHVLCRQLMNAQTISTLLPGTPNLLTPKRLNA